MGLLFDAAVAWDNLKDTTYTFTLGHRGKSSQCISLSFCPDEFPHLAGMHYATDVDFNANRAEIQSKKLIDKLLQGKIDSSLIEKAEKWEVIKGRLQGIIRLEQTLDSEFRIFNFNPARVIHSTAIVAEYIVKGPLTGCIFFIFLDAKENRWFCKSIFPWTSTDYTANQIELTVLKKQKAQNGIIVNEYTHPGYKPNFITV